MTTLVLQFNNVRFDVIDHNGQPWLRVHQIGVALGYARPDSINKVYQSNADEFTDKMTSLIEIQTQGGKQKVRIFSLRGCHLLAMLARTEVAKQFRQWVLDVLDHLPAQAKPTSPFDDMLPTLLPFQRVNSALLSELRRMSKSLAQAYLLECEVTPEYVNSQLSKLNTAHPDALPEPGNAMPIGFLMHEIPAQASQQDAMHFYFLHHDFAKLCGDYDPIETARLLRSLGLLKCYHRTLKAKAPRHLFGAVRPMVYIVKKAELAAYAVEQE